VQASPGKGPKRVVYKKKKEKVVYSVEEELAMEVKPPIPIVLNF